MTRKWGWSAPEDKELESLLLGGQHSFKEIGEKLGRSGSAAQLRAKRLGIRTRHSISKHKHLRRPVMKYYQSHSFDDTASHFGLTRSEMKSLLTVTYRDRSLSGIRKDTRTHEPFKLADSLFMLRHAGIQPRTWIALELGRTKGHRFHAIKERLSSMGTSSRYVNGLPQRLASILLFGAKPYQDTREVLIEGIKTAAGAPGPHGICHHVLVPWVTLAREVRWKRNIPDHLRRAVRAMAKFQRFIHATDDDRLIEARLRRYAKKGES